MVTARELWTRLETIHAVTYFAPESRAAADAAGLRGFWMGYFAFRAAPLGAVGPEVVSDAFFNFAPGMVARSIPDAWERAEPDELIVARRTSAAAALRRLAPGVDGIDLAAVAALMDASHAPDAGAGLPLYTANRALASPTDVVEMVWQLCTTLREHRGDAHVAALRSAGLDGIEAHLLLAADAGVPEPLLRDNRGWSETGWERARTALRQRGLLAASGALTPEGHAVRASVEAATDARAAEAFDGVIDGALVLQALDPIARAVVTSDVIPFPNPMGLPRFV